MISRRIINRGLSPILLAIPVSGNNWLAYGDERFEDQIEVVITRSVRDSKDGRPKNQVTKSMHDEFKVNQGVEG